MNKKTAIKIIRESAIVYDNQFVNQNLMIVFGNINAPDTVEIKGSSSNFLHLTGMSINKSFCPSAEMFFKKALHNKLQERDFDFKDGTAIQKLQVLKQVLNVSKNANMIGDYNYNSAHIKLDTHKLAGNIRACIGFKRNGKYFIPNTVLNTDMRNETINTQRILMILSKSISEINYNNIEYVAKGIDTDSLLKVLK